MRLLSALVLTIATLSAIVVASCHEGAGAPEPPTGGVDGGSHNPSGDGGGTVTPDTGAFMPDAGSIGPTQDAF
jgi:hypothetical protein